MTVSPSSDASPTYTPLSSPEGSPTTPSLLAQNPRPMPTELRLSGAAIKTLEALTELAPSPTLWEPGGIRDAFNEFGSNTLSLINQRALTDRALGIILPYCRLLQKLDLAGFTKITDAVLPHIVALRHLQVLNISGTRIKTLQPLIDNPLPNLKAAFFYQTPIPAEGLISFLNCHKISTISHPQNLPKDFFKKININILRDVTLHVDSSNSDVIGFDEIMELLQQAPLQRLEVWFKRAITEIQLQNLALWSLALKKEISFTAINGQWMFQPTSQTSTD